MRKRILIVGLIVAALGWWCPVRATTLIQLDTKALANRADTILIGRVALPPKPVRAEGGMIYSKVTIVVDDYVWASVPQQRQVRQIELAQWGGTYNGVTTLVPGAPTFSHSERVLLFLRRNEVTNAFSVVGLSQGKFQIRTEPQTGREYVVQDLGQVELVPIQQEKERVGFNAGALKKDSSVGQEQAAPTRSSRRYLDEFIREIVSYKNPDSMDKVFFQSKP